MKRIAIISDTHTYHDEMIEHNLRKCDEIWHLGDIGNPDLLEMYETMKPLSAVYGNIDNHEIRCVLPRKKRFVCEGLSILMTHIGGYPGRYDRSVKDEIDANPPDVFLSGHSHILKIMPDKRRGLLHINPGAAGNIGFHKFRTMVVLEIDNKNISDIKVIELGRRGVI
jgi:putative phosphoesterase